MVLECSFIKNRLFLEGGDDKTDLMVPTILDNLQKSWILMKNTESFGKAMNFESFTNQQNLFVSPAMLQLCDQNEPSLFSLVSFT